MQCNNSGCWRTRRRCLDLCGDTKTAVQYQYLLMAFLVVELCWQESAQLLDALTYAILAHLLALSLLLAVPVVTMAIDMTQNTTPVVTSLRTG